MDGCPFVCVFRLVSLISHSNLMFHKKRSQRRASHTLLVTHLAHQNTSCGINLQKPLTDGDSLPLLYIFLQWYDYTHCRAQERSAAKEQHNAVLFPLPHVTKGWKSTDTRRGRPAPQTFVYHCCTSVPTLCCQEVAQRWKGTLEVNYTGAGQGLEHSQDFLMESSCSWLMMQKPLSSHH